MEVAGVTLKARVRRLAVRGSRAWYRFRGPRQPGPPEPPTVPSGWTTGPPRYVGVGAQKAGTSWWNRLIQAHPDVVNAGGQAKELHFFDRCWETPFDESDVERYHRSVSYTHLTLPTSSVMCRSRWSPYH